MSGKKRSNKPRPVIAYQPDGVRTFASVSEASRHYGLSVSNICLLIRTAGVSNGGVSFDYIDL